MLHLSSLAFINTGIFLNHVSACLLYDNGALGAWLYNNWLHDNQDNSVEASEASTNSVEASEGATFVFISLYQYRNIPESLRQTIPAYWLLVDSGATVIVSQDDSLMINIIMSSDLVLGLSEHCRATAKGESVA